MASRKEHPVGAVNLEKVIDSEGRHVPHNCIHKVLREQGLAKKELKKSRRRKWVRYERRNSNSLWHCDWFEERGGQLIILEDDASRLIESFGMFSKLLHKR